MRPRLLAVAALLTVALVAGLAGPALLHGFGASRGGLAELVVVVPGVGGVDAQGELTLIYPGGYAYADFRYKGEPVRVVFKVNLGEAEARAGRVISESRERRVVPLSGVILVLYQYTPGMGRYASPPSSTAWSTTS